MAGVRVEQSFGELREWQKLGLTGHWALLEATTALPMPAAARSRPCKTLPPRMNAHFVWCFPSAESRSVGADADLSHAPGLL